MSTQDLNQILNRHCRFRFRGGKEAYGVIWQPQSGGLVFSSMIKHKNLTQSAGEIDLTELLQIDSNDEMVAELIA